jgi:hypothetical protein
MTNAEIARSMTLGKIRNEQSIHMHGVVAAWVHQHQGLLGMHE